ncbi:hypothetical protein RS030_2194 [Cryptosporidium xiaoi]|uniref:Uncharacterized protein n=1 Tax=Cryptosporidium xiaoi TaxID=659607 RepID=A0AAV9XVH7_9CRYT
MRRLQSFKSPSKLNEKLKFTNRGVVNNTPIQNGVKFIPNIGVNEYIDSDKQSTRKSSQFLTEPSVEKKVTLELIEEKNDSNSLNISPRNNKKLSVSEVPFNFVNIDDCQTERQVKENMEKCYMGDIENNNGGVFHRTNKIDHSGWSIIQLPKYLPSGRCSIQNDLDSHNSNFPSLLHEMPPGSIGKLVIRKNGDAKISLNGNSSLESIDLNVKREISCSEQTIFALNKINELVNLGSCGSKLIVTPKILDI